MDGVTCKVVSDQPHLVLSVEVNLLLSRDRQATSIGQPRCTLNSEDAMEAFEIPPCVRIRKRVQETLNLLHNFEGKCSL
jgi:hypothetical protein